MKKSISQIINNNGRVFIVPLDHPEGNDTKKLSKIGVQNFVNRIDSINFNGYIFHSRDYLNNPIKTKKDFFLTVGEQPENYKLDIEKLKKFKRIKNLTIFFEVNDINDKEAVKFYKEYVKKLKSNGYLVMGMGYPSNKYKNPNYQVIADIAYEIGCDFFKTDLHENIANLKLNGMKLFIAGGSYLDDKNFEKFINKIENLKIASASIGRNIFESDYPEDRIKMVISKLIS